MYTTVCFKRTTKKSDQLIYSWRWFYAVLPTGLRPFNNRNELSHSWCNSELTQPHPNQLYPASQKCWPYSSWPSVSVRVRPHLTRPRPGKGQLPNPVPLNSFMGCQPGRITNIHCGSRSDACMAYAPSTNHQVAPPASQLFPSSLSSSIIDLLRSIITVYQPLKRNFSHAYKRTALYTEYSVQ